ncbi:MAG: DNA double-strand break repair nuclease NurA [Candidatus Micrarchaeota archaeon]|nr:DNA double-strand break repair nuclease NurA [Candidatus Micrarchaeota archaeon]
MYNEHKLDEFFKKIKNQQDSFSKIINNFNSLDFSTTSLEPLGEKIILDVEQKPFDLKVAAVDCGFQSFEKFNQTLILYKVCGAIFEYKNSKLFSYSYFPKNSEIEMEAAEDLDNFENLKFASLTRLKAEISTAIEIIKNNRPDLVLLDGSILPLASDKPSKESVLFVKYLNLVKLYEELFDLSKKNNVLICGVVKDSKSKRFFNLLYEKGLIEQPRFSDILCLNYILKQKQRTAFFSLEKEFSEDFSFPNLFLACYIKTSPHLLPLRLELSYYEKIIDFPSLFLSLAEIGTNFAYPPILAEVDLRSRLNEKQIEDFVDFLYSKAYKLNYLDFLGFRLKPFK